MQDAKSAMVLILTDGITVHPVYLIVGAVVIAFIWLLRAPFIDPREPPLKKSFIPGIGHGIGIIRYKSKYLEMLRTKYQLPIFMIPILREKIVIVTSPDMIQNALCAKSLSFDPISTQVTQAVIGAKTTRFAEAFTNPGDGKEVNYYNEMHAVNHNPLAPGPDLQHTNKIALGRLSVFVNEVGSAYIRRDLYKWVRDIFTITTATSLFGARNPVESDYSLIPALWEFEAGVPVLFADFFPSIIAPKACKGRAKIQAALREYFKAGYYNDDDVSAFTKRRTFINLKYGFTPEDCGNFDVGILLVSTINSIPIIYWFIVYVFSQPAVIASIRAEVMSTIKVSTDPTTGSKVMTINTSKFNTYCPFLISAYQETQRLCNKNMSIRIALQDTTISSPTEGTYLIKKGTTVLMPSALHTSSTKFWGPDAHSFVATRFLNRDKEAEKAQRKVYIPFGGGRHYCPGRHFASAEILGFVAVMCTGFEIVMADGANGEPGGPIRVPGREDRYLGEAVPKPKSTEKLEVLIRRREGFEDVQWRFEVGDMGT